MEKGMEKVRKVPGSILLGNAISTVFAFCLFYRDTVGK